MAGLIEAIEIKGKKVKVHSETREFAGRTQAW